ncbi:MAG: BREX system serine/threonine kinase PglW [Bradymonadaceae bacterium]|nr:BREX system serine/threonine kinase PglW [Lujinxingiaceae bacterium]
MNDVQWVEATIADGERKRAALAFLKSALPDYAPYKAWTNFQFLSLEGGFFDVDALVFSEAGIFLVELATERGRLEIGARTWRHTQQNGQFRVFDSPMRTARLKAENLHALLEYHTPGNYHVPPIQALVFVCDDRAEPEISADAAAGVFCHPSLAQLPSVLHALVDGNGPGVHRLTKALNRDVLGRFNEVVDNAGFEPTSLRRRLGDFDITELIDTTEFYQDFLARHRSTDEVLRARLFRAPRRAGDEQLARIQEAARREYAIVSELTHPSILQARRHLGHETRPTVFFEHPAGAVRLDHYLDQTNGITAATRFKILEATAEAVRYAHENRVVHRALSPQSVLVIPGVDDQPPEVRLYNWHTGAHAGQETGTRHIADYLHDTSHLFLAPELGQAVQVDEAADVFGLGAIAYFLFTGEPPARDLPDYIRTLFEHGGLRLTAVRDAVTPELDALIFDATRARPDDRLHSVDAFLARLAGARGSLVAVGRAGLIDPLEAAPGTIIADRYEVKRRLGSGATATAFLVEREGREFVLKIANDDAHTSRLQAEAEALARLDHPLIVDLVEIFEAGGRTILAIQNAGTTFRDRLRESRALSLDELRRFGSDLCQACQALEAQHVFHRDIKPANLGIGQLSGSRQHLMLFDFSLAGVAIERVDVGTAAYRDPFLITRRRWDAYAERYAGALVLYEMVAQQLPRWGDGRGNPAVEPDSRLQLAPERFPAAVRDELRPFFEKALAREVTARFDNATEMLRAWDDIFERTLHTDHGVDGLDEQLQKASPSTALATLGISQVAIDALDTMNVISVRDMLARPSHDYNFLTGVSNQIRTQLRELRDRLADLFPQLVYGSEHTADPVEPDDYSLKTVDHLLEYVLEKRGGSARSDLTELIATMLVSDGTDQSLPWPMAVTMAKRTGKSSAEFAELFTEIAARWLRKLALVPLRQDLVRIIDQAGGAISFTDLSHTVLGERGSIRVGAERMSAATAVTRAAIEAELVSDAPRLLIRRQNDETFVATNQALLQLLPRLAELADQLATEDPLASPERAYDAINDLLEKADLEQLQRHRALALAAAASSHAALSQRDELYPRGMSARRTLTLTANVLLRQAPLSLEQLHTTVHNRYPQAAPLPERSELEALLAQAEIALKWNTALFASKGGFDFAHDHHPDLAISRSTQAATLFVTSTTYQTGHDADLEIERFEDRLGYKSRNGGFLTLMVHPAHAPKAPAHLARTYDLTIVSLEEFFLRHMRAQAEAKNISWTTLLSADAPNADDRDRRNFAHFLRHFVLDHVRTELLALRGRVLLTNPGLLARYNDEAATMSLLDALRDALTSTTGPELVWLLISADAQRTRPQIDNAPVPVTDDSEYIRIPSRWLKK